MIKKLNTRASQSAITYSKSTIEILKQCVKSVQKYQQRHHNEVRLLSGVFIANFEQISHLVLMFLLLTLSK